VNKPILARRINRRLMLFQEYEFEIFIKPRKSISEPNHLFRIDNDEEGKQGEEGFPYANLFSV